MNERDWTATAAATATGPPCQKVVGEMFVVKQREDRRVHLLLGQVTRGAKHAKAEDASVGVLGILGGSRELLQRFVVVHGGGGGCGACGGREVEEEEEEEEEEEQKCEKKKCVSGDIFW